LSISIVQGNENTATIINITERKNVSFYTWLSIEIGYYW